MYDVDVNGTHNVLEAAGTAGTAQVLVTSSAVAYGAFPDNPVPLTEEDPVRGVPGFSYARDKTESDRSASSGRGLARPHDDDRPPLDRVRPQRRQLPVAPMDQAAVRGRRREPGRAIQFMHEDDVVEAVTGLLLGRHAGAFNVAADGEMTLRECAELLGTPIRKMPLRAYRGLAKTMWGSAPVRGAAGPDRVRAPPLDRVEREAEEDHRLAAQAHQP